MADTPAGTTTDHHQPADASASLRVLVVDDQDPQGRARIGGLVVVCGGTGGRVSHGVFLVMTWGDRGARGRARPKETKQR